ncbi:MAG: hypothetical protein AAFN74_08690, partial [Myxococcota bacterium]
MISENDRLCLKRIEDDLVSRRIFAPLDKTHDEHSRWHRNEMASIVEGYVGEQLSFDALDKVTWENLRLKFGNYFEIPTCAELLCPQHKDRRYWILDAQGEPCGTMGLSLR